MASNGVDILVEKWLNRKKTALASPGDLQGLSPIAVFRSDVTASTAPEPIAPRNKFPQGQRRKSLIWP